MELEHSHHCHPDSPRREPPREHAHSPDTCLGRCQHPHGPAPDSSGNRLLITLVLNLVIPTAQIIGGIYANSMALVSDAAHNFSDFTAVLIAYVANRISRRGASVANTFGYKRVEILAAFVNVAVLLGVAAFILLESFHRLRQPDAVSGALVAAVAGIGVAGNGLSAWLLHRDSKHSLNIRGAFLHMLGDLFTSVAVLVSGLMLMFKPWYWLDPALSGLIAVFIARNCWVILKEATCILMNATPSGLDIRQIKEFLENIPGIYGVHYLHAWNVCSSSIAFSCHLVVPDQQLSTIDGLSAVIRGQLFQRFGIDHPILQFETRPCGDGSLFCGMACSTPGNAHDRGNEAASGEGGGSLSRHGAPRVPDGGPPGPFWKSPVFWVRLFLGALFILASMDKIHQPEAFARVISNYQILPDGLISLTAIVLPWLEFILGVLLIAGWWLPGASLLATLLLAVFFAALAFNLARGLNVHCGCFWSTPAAGDPATHWYLVRDSALLLSSLYLSCKVLGRRIPATRQASHRR